MVGAGLLAAAPAEPFLATELCDGSVGRGEDAAGAGEEESGIGLPLGSGMAVEPDGTLVPTRGIAFELDTVLEPGNGIAFALGAALELERAIGAAGSFFGAGEGRGSAPFVAPAAAEAPFER